MRQRTPQDANAAAFVHGGWLDKSRHGLVLLRVVSRRPGVTLRTVAPVAAAPDTAAPDSVAPDTAPSAAKESTGRHCIVLHGWASSGEESRDLWQAVRESPAASRWQFWDVSYDSNWTAFDESARRIVTALRAEPAHFSDVILIGNSMGGVVARQMVALGFPCRALISICSPHHGPAPWVPVPSPGPRSIARWSRPLKRLNSDPVDRAHRDRYHLFAITYDDRVGHHEHDGIIQARSALGENLGPVAQRTRIHLRYRSIATFDPHWRGRFANHLPPVVETLNNLMQR